MTQDEIIYCTKICKITDKFSKIEDYFFEKYPELIDTKNYFISKGIVINRYKTLENNNIKDGDIITLNKLKGYN